MLRIKLFLMATYGANVQHALFLIKNMTLDHKNAVTLDY